MRLNTKIISLTMATMLLLSSVVACGSKTENDKINETDTTSSVTIGQVTETDIDTSAESTLPESDTETFATETDKYYIDEDTGDIIDADTGEIVTDKNLVVDEDTGNIVDKNTGEVVQTKEETDKVKDETTTVTTAQTTTTTTRPATTTTAAQTTPPVTTTRPATTTTTTRPAQTTTPTPPTPNITLPTSSKVTSFNKQKLYDKMVSIYEKPVLEGYTPLMTMDEYIHQVHGEIPSNCKYIYDWFMNIIDGKTTQYTLRPKSESDISSFTNFMGNQMNCFLLYDFGEDHNGRWYIVDRTALLNDIQTQYNEYATPIKSNNESATIIYNNRLEYYNETIAYISTDCDSIEKAVKAANAVGKNEVVAITNIINYICNNCRYWEEAVPVGNGLGACINDCLVRKEAVCDGYAKTFYAMCYSLGIDVTYYYGHTNTGEQHAWNSVKINGQDYYFDITWYDTTKSENYIWCSLTKFNKEHIEEGRTPYYW